MAAISVAAGLHLNKTGFYAASFFSQFRGTLARTGFSYCELHSILPARATRRREAIAIGRAESGAGLLLAFQLARCTH